MSDIRRVFAGDGSYDALQEREQAAVRAAWNERLAERISTFDLGAVIEQEGVGWAENDEQGNVVVTNGTAGSCAPRRRVAVTAAESAENAGAAEEPDTDRE